MLRAIPLFRVLGDDGIAWAVRAGMTRRYKAGQIIFHRGDPGDSLYAVLEGLVKVVFTAERGDEIVLNTLGPGETFGELALLDGSPRSASILTARSTWVFALPRPQLLALMREHPALTDEFLRMLGGLVRSLTERAADSAFLDLAGRLAKLLLRLADGRDGGGVRDGARVERGLTQSDLAALIGASRPAVNRALQTLAARKFIETRGRVIVLRDVAALRRRAGL
jgi:CRP-like cAMP-binding protein